MHPLTWTIAQRACDTLPPIVVTMAEQIAARDIRPRAQEVAEACGYHSRFEMARRLHGAHLPRYRKLVNWLTVLDWIVRSEIERRTMDEIAAEIHRNRTSCYRLVKRTTGLTWSDLQQRGLAWMIVAFDNACAGQSQLGVSAVQSL
jgi:hypothetical protein